MTGPGGLVMTTPLVQGDHLTRDIPLRFVLEIIQSAI